MISEIIKYVTQLSTLNLHERHVNYYRNFLKEGVEFDSKTINSNSLLQQYCQINDPQLKACYRNSLLLAVTCEEIQYVEGYIYSGDIGIPIEHAWNTDIYENIIDTTATLWQYTTKYEYFGVIIPKEILSEYLETKQVITALQFYLNSKWK